MTQCWTLPELRAWLREHVAYEKSKVIESVDAATAAIAEKDKRIVELQGMIPDPSTSDRFYYDLGRRDAQVLIDAAQKQTVDCLNQQAKQDAEIERLRAKLATAIDYLPEHANQCASMFAGTAECDCEPGELHRDAAEGTPCEPTERPE